MSSQETVIVDSSLGFREAIAGTEAPPFVIATLCLFDVRYYSEDDRLHQGQLVTHRSVQAELTDIFDLIRKTRFPVAKVLPIVQYGWLDEASMADNNTSAFNYRFIAGSSRLSYHATGLAIDINPARNPVIYADGSSLPPCAVYNPPIPGTLTPDSPILQAFIARGWRWGGNFPGWHDYHHFEKPR